MILFESQLRRGHLVQMKDDADCFSGEVVEIKGFDEGDDGLLILVEFGGDECWCYSYEFQPIEGESYE